MLPPDPRGATKMGVILLFFVLVVLDLLCNFSAEECNFWLATFKSMLLHGTGALRPLASSTSLSLSLHSLKTPSSCTINY